MRKGKKLANICLLHWLRPPPHTHTYNTTLHTGMMLTRGISAFVVAGLMLTRGISAFVVGSQRRIIITHDLDIYKCALQIKQSVVDINWILQAVFCQSVYCICCPTWPWQNNCWKWHWHMCHWKWYLNFCSSSWKLWWQYMGGIEYHIKTHLAIMIVSLMSLYMWYTKEDSMNEDQTWLHFLKMSCMALRKYRMEPRHWGACSVLHAVPRAGDSVLNLISACQSDDWEGIFLLHL